MGENRGTKDCDVACTLRPLRRHVGVDPIRVLSFSLENPIVLDVVYRVQMMYMHVCTLAQAEKFGGVRRRGGRAERLCKRLTAPHGCPPSCSVYVVGPKRLQTLTLGTEVGV